MKYFVIGDENTVTGFGLSGVRGRIARNPDEASQAFSEAISSGDTGIIIMTERTADMIRETVDSFIFSGQFPFVVEVTDRKGREENRPGIRELVNTAIGIRL